MPEPAAREPVEWGIATRCRRGETTSGDLAVVTLLPEGVLVAGIDGLGHGDEAARAARKAADGPAREAEPRPRAARRALPRRIEGHAGAAISLAFVSPGGADDLARRRQRGGTRAQR